MAGKIFVNYRRDDSAPHALSVAQYLEREFGSASVFLDIDRLRPGQKFPKVLEERLTESRVMLALIGPSWLNAVNEIGQRRLDDPEDWVRLEISSALARDIPVIPVLVGGATLPRKRELPDDLKPLVEHQIATVSTNGFRTEMAGLARDVRDILRPHRTWPIAAGAAAAAALAIGLAIYFGGIAEFGFASLFPSNATQTVELDAKRRADAAEAKLQAEQSARANAEARAKDLADAADKAREKAAAVDAARRKAEDDARAKTAEDAKRNADEAERRRAAMLAEQERQRAQSEEVARKAADDARNRTAAALPQATIAGTWKGTYSYPNGGAPVNFTFLFDQACSGRAEEPNTFGNKNSAKLYAEITCTDPRLTPGARVVIHKQYDGAGGVSHSVEYIGTVSLDLNEIAGQWRIGSNTGPFQLRR
jgi:hypothetical protein